MSKGKEGSPFDEGTPYEEILGIPSGQLRETVRRSKKEEKKKDLLTSQDLFGDIIGELEVDGANVATRAQGTTGSTPTSSPTGPEPHGLSEAAGSDVTPERALGSKTVASREATEPELDAVADALGVAAFGETAGQRGLEASELHREIEQLVDEPAETGGEKPDYGQYLLLERIATGGMAEVFRAKRKGLGGFEKVFALKRIRPELSENQEFLDMFIAEAKMVAGLCHPNIVQIFDLGKKDETYYIAMEYVDGKDLRSILARARRAGTTIGVDLAALIARQVASALAYAHRQKDAEGRPLQLVHRDVSPQNILIAREGVVKLVDFGIAKAAVKASHTDSGSLRGKLLYMSPEQAWGRQIDKRSDIFSLGLVLFEILTGRSLFMDASDMSILERVREARVISPSSLSSAVPVELDAVTGRALRKDPPERYQDATEMIRDLDAYLRRRPAVGSTDLAELLEDVPSGSGADTPRHR
ncbi:MAG: serine/threonine-protein kinase [Acidobacteriota bacterium]